MSAAPENILLEIPREIPLVTGMSPEELKQELAFTLYSQDRISFGKARELAGLTAWRFQDELGRRAIPVHYDSEAFAEDLAALRDLGRL